MDGGDANLPDIVKYKRLVKRKIMVLGKSRSLQPQERYASVFQHLHIEALQQDRRGHTLGRIQWKMY